MSVASTRDSALHLRVIESLVRLEVPDPARRAVIARQWGRCLVDPPAGSKPTLDLRLEEEGTTWRLTGRLTQHAIEQLLGRRLMIHSAAVCDDAGRVIALVGRSDAGKSTAAATLAASTFGYVTDETVVVRRPDTVVPYPRPVSLDDPETGEEVDWGPDELGLRTCPRALRLARLVVLDRNPRHDGPPTLSRLPLLEGVLALAPEISALARLTAPLEWLCRLITDCGGVLRLSYAEVADAAPVLARLLDQPADGAEAWTHVPARTGLWLPVRDGRVRQAWFTDAVVVDDEALVLVHQTPVRLIGLGLTLWRAAVRAPTFPELLARAVAAHGDHPDAAQLVAEAAEALVEAGVLDLGGPSTFAELAQARP